MADRTISDSQFEQAVDRIFPPESREKGFYAKIAGAKHRNRDGSSRTALIDLCNTFDILTLEAEPDNPVDPNAVAVFRTAGGQIGYFDSRLAGEATRDAKLHGGRWVAIFRNKNHHPDTGAVVGAVLYVIRLTDESALEHERKVALKNAARTDGDAQPPPLALAGSGSSAGEGSIQHSSAGVADSGVPDIQDVHIENGRTMRWWGVLWRKWTHSSRTDK